MGRSRPLSVKHAIVTGASRGIGAAIARRLAAGGAAVTLVAREAKRLQAQATALEHEFGARCHCAAADVTDPRQVAGALRGACEALGPADVLVNNVGAVETAPFVDTDPKMWKRMIDANLNSVFFCCREVLPDMIERGEGRVVNIASTAGLEGYAYVSAYTAAKHAVVGLTRALALETAKHGVTVNAICPGYTNTELLEASIVFAAEKTGRSTDEIRARYAAANRGGRLIEPAEVADRVAALCVPEGANITGQVIRVDGGEERG